ncbi:MAG TPA: PorP/SprF family type IX secretion system membrane protein [Saprospiraceae bacterium]|nr:PorP/SprF family type IX secretion system membrane protein [Lewinellaceae bacterium]HRX29896.1 PorP/SprF family type IX secretion system membrane protein [Saprospiraceae bacterium]
MKLNLRHVVVLLILCMSWTVKGQDIHFSQFYNSPLNLNPAMTGVLNCKNRFILNYRNQWAAVLKANAYNTFSASYDQKVPVGREDYFGIGGTLWSDVAGESRFGTSQGRLSLSYSKKMSGYRKKAGYLVFGFDAGITQRKFSEKDLRWPNQITNGEFNNTPSGETYLDTDFLYADVTAGLLWFSILDKNTNWYVGAAMHHLNRANISFYGADESLYTRLTLHAGAQFELKPRIKLLPNIIYMTQGPHRELNLGANLRFAMGPSRLTNQSWELGLWFRNADSVNGGIYADALIINTRFNYDKFGIGFNYDFNVSDLNAASAANGAFEFSLEYLICGPENRGVYCPRF